MSGPVSTENRTLPEYLEHCAAQLRANPGMDLIHALYDGKVQVAARPDSEGRVLIHISEGHFWRCEPDLAARLGIAIIWASVEGLILRSDGAEADRG